MTALIRATARGRAESAPPAHDPVQYLTFMLRGEVYAIGILSIKEIIEYGGLTGVPMMPATIRGVINLRGAVVPVMDLAVRFGRPAGEATKRTCIVIVELAVGDERQVVGIVVDAVNAVQEIAPADIEPAPSFGMAIAADFVSGMGKVNGKFVILLDIQQVLAIQGLAAAREAADEPLRLAAA
jgi:purine-binding chemotaxis protein CheW